MAHRTYLEFMREDRRLAILRILADLPGYRSNSSILHTLLQHLAHTSSRDDVRTDIAWLAEQGLVSAELIAGIDGLFDVGLSERGLDVSAGRALVPGIARPGPR